MGGMYSIPCEICGTRHQFVDVDDDHPYTLAGVAPPPVLPAPPPPPPEPDHDGGAAVSRRQTNALLTEILAELRILRELAILEMKFPDLTTEERKNVVQRIKDWQA